MHASTLIGGAARRLCSVAAIAIAIASAAAALAAAKPTPESATSTTTLAPDAGRMVVDVKGVPPPPPLFYSAAAEQSVRLSAAEVVTEARVRLHVVQGRPELLTLGLSGEGEVVGITGAALKDWSVRQIAGATGGRLIDLRPQFVTGQPESRDFEYVILVRRNQLAIPGNLPVALVTPGDAVGFASQIALRADDAIDLRVVSASGLVAVGETAGTRDVQRYYGTGDARLEVKLARRGASQADAELVGAQLVGKLTDGASSVDFHLRGQLRAQKAGARLRVLSGHAALSEGAAGDGWHVELSPAGDDGAGYDLVSDRAGVFAVDVALAAEVRENGDWRQLEFSMPAGAVVPVVIEGLGADATFKPDSAIVPVAVGETWQGFLPADGAASLAWRRTREAGEGTLFFSTTEQTEVRVGVGLLRQASSLTMRVLQGKLSGLRCRLEGPGEILGVDGNNIVGWKLVPGQGGRWLEVRFSRPVETEGSLVVRSQAELGAYPARAEPLRLVPEGVVRHSGFLRVANTGAVRLELADVSGMMQLAPAQFPGGPIDAGSKQVFVYRFPSASYAYRVLASQIQPEVGVSQIALYQLGETDRAIAASLELDVREAPLKDWTIQIPDDYTVVSVVGERVADYLVESVANGGYRALKVMFSEPIESRQLVELRLEKNQPAAAGDWQLRPLRFPGAKTVRGHVAAVSTPGYRVAPARVDRLVEIPLSFFPNQVPGLQQAWRLREADWSADVKIEALGQSIQADVFHLYSVKEGVVYGSVLLNYFVVGAPASEWRLEVPAGLGNIDVVGQNVRRDWRREGDQVVVSLHQPVLGAATLLVTFQQPMSARGGSIRPGEVRPLGVQAERGFLEIVSPLQVKNAVRVSEGGLLKLEPGELPAEFRLLSTSPALAVYQYTARPFNLEMGIEWYAPGETVDQIVDFAKLTSQISRDGQVVTDVQYYVKTRGRKALRMVLPPGVKLWEARVDNEVTNARVDGEQTLVPLSAKLNPNEPVAVLLRLGQTAGSSASRVKLLAPRTTAATVISEWTVNGDAGRFLVPKGGNAELTRAALAETGFEWVSRHGRLAVSVLITALALAAFAVRSDSRVRRAGGLLLSLICAGGAAILLETVAGSGRTNAPQLVYSATMVPAGQAVSIDVANVGEIGVMVTGWGIAVGLVGLAALALAARGRGLLSVRALRGFATTLGVILLSAGLLAQRGGAVYFFGILTLAIAVFLVFPAVKGLTRRPEDEQPPTPGPGMPGVTPLLLLGTLVGAIALASGTSLRAEKPAVSTAWLQHGERAAQSVVQTWSVRGDRLFAEAEFTVRGGPGDSFLLLKAPAVLTEFKGDGLRVGKVDRDGQPAYFVALEREGVLVARAKFEMPLGDRSRGIAVPTGPAAAQRVTLELDQGGWEFGSSAAVKILPTAGLGEKKSGATLVLAPTAAPVIQLIPKRRDIASEATQYFAEVANLYVPGPGAVNGYARVTIRPVQGRVSEIQIDVPKGLTVGDVGRGPVGAWRFDPEKRRLHVSIEPAQSRAFRFDLETQLGAGALPFDLGLEPSRVVGAAGDVGLIGLAFGGDAQPEAVRAKDLSAVSVQDFDASLLPRARDGAAVSVQQVWRYGQSGGRVDLRIAPVAPEVRVASRQVISLDDDRLVMATDLNVAITRVGLFKLSFALPEGLEVEALSGAALSHWTEAQDGAQRIVTLHLNGSTLGEQSFAITLAGAAPHAQTSWPVPRISVREATRQTGEVLIVPGKGIRLRAVDREKVTQLDPRSVGGLQPGTLAFRLLQEDWLLRLGIESLDPWVTVQSLQEITLREGQTLTRLALRYRVENAAVKVVRVRLPGIGEDRARTVRATGPAVSEIVRVPDNPELWDVHFQRGIAGETEVQIEFQGPAAQEKPRESVTTPEFPGARQAVQFVSLRAGGRLDLDAGELPRGWSRIDWSAVPAHLQNRSDRSVPALCYRVAEPEGPLDVAVRRHEVADALKLRVTRGELTTQFSPNGDSLTAVELQFDVLEKSTLRVRLPERARLFNTFVNGESVSVVRESDAYLFHVTPSTGDRAATVRLVYSAEGKSGGIALEGPRLSVPLENVQWRVILPPGYDLRSYAGGLRLEAQQALGRYGLDEYRSIMLSKRSAESQQAAALLQEASSLLQRGDQKKAGEVLSRASNAPTLDLATSEDARVQLRNLKTQQTVLGLNTRRQRLYLDNRVDAARNEQLEQAASLNPFMQGKENFDPQQVDQLLMGNTVEENTALRGIAARLVDQQLSAEPAPGAIDVTLPQAGRVLTFTRSVQVDGGAPLALALKLKRTAATNVVFSSLMLLALGAITLLPFAKQTRSEA
ncbi:hypothetical protein DB347_23750 [Opitutaceae bacterium EW11]|nr:hypothetical protein DB347_23750 [Opitutaceae bacterium EW11]